MNTAKQSTDGTSSEKITITTRDIRNEVCVAMKDIEEGAEYRYQSIADINPATVKVLHIDKKVKRIEVSRDLMKGTNPFYIDQKELKHKESYVGMTGFSNTSFM